MYEDCIEKFSCNRYPSRCSDKCYRTAEGVQIDCETQLIFGDNSTVTHPAFTNECPEQQRVIPQTIVVQGPPGKDGVDGKDLEFQWVYTDTEVRLGVRVKGTEEWFYSSSLIGPSVKGDKGDKGEDGKDGDRGPQGIQGPQGVRGPQGIQGPKGDKGDVGPQGFQGPQGIQGETGPKGDKGDKGDTGPQGIQGEKGDKGDRGNDGTGVTILGSYNTLQELQTEHPTGVAGDSYLINNELYIWSPSNSEWQNVGNIKGPQGDTGPKGDKGDKGDQGEQGIQGDTGATFIPTVNANCDLSWTNDKGLSNPVTVNIKGDKGDKGDQGEQGFTPYPQNGTWWVNGVDTGVPSANPYILPIASGVILGGIKVGSRLTIDANGVLSADIQTTDLSNYYTKAQVDSKIPVVPTELSAFNQDPTHRLTTDAEKAVWNSKAPASSVVNINVAVSDWVADSTYTEYTHRCTKAVSGVTANNNIILGLTGTATTEQENAASTASVTCKGQGVGTISLYAKSIPTLDLPVQIIILG